MGTARSAPSAPSKYVQTTSEMKVISALRPTEFPTIGHTVQTPRVPIWCVGALGSSKSMARATRWDGLIPQVIDNGKMLRNFVQILRSGVTGRKSLGSAPKRLVRQWLERATERQLVQATIGNDPSLADVVKMVHPRPADAARRTGDDGAFSTQWLVHDRRVSSQG